MGKSTVDKELAESEGKEKKNGLKGITARSGSVSGSEDNMLESVKTALDCSELQHNTHSQHNSLSTCGNDRSYSYEIVNKPVEDDASNVRIVETQASVKKDVRFRRTSSCNNVAASFIDILKKAVHHATEAVNEAALEQSDGVSQGERSGKKKRKKGRHIDPALFGFKVTSNRIIMGEIQRLDD
ncbi:hypothetical protein DITRI_Ditri16bG0150000 [Diplodiscus trichospermus]